jgi:hypothetical protein
MDDKIKYIFDNVNHLELEYRRHILQMIYSSKFKSAIKEKGNGCQIRLSDLDEDIVNEIHEFVTKKIEDQSFDFYV